MLNFKELGVNVSFNDTDIKDTIQVPLGEWWSVSVPYGGSCDRVAIVECKKNVLCEEETEIGHRSCLRKLEYNDTAWVGIIVEDEEDVPAFTLNATDDEGNEIDVFTFEGGTLDDLLDSHDAIEMTSFGVNMYFDKDYAANGATITNDDLYLTNSTFCLRRSNKAAVDFSFCDYGCYRIVIYRKEKAIWVSNKIEVVANNDNASMGTLVEYYKDGFYYRHRLPIYLGDIKYETEETEKKMSDGNFSIYDSTIRPYVPFKTDLLTMEEHFWLLQVLKGSDMLKVNGRMVYSRGAYEAGLAGIDRRYSGAGNLYFRDMTKVYNSNECGSDGCNNASTLTYEIFEREKEGTILVDSANLLSLAP